MLESFLKNQINCLQKTSKLGAITTLSLQPFRNGEQKSKNHHFVFFVNFRNDDFYSPYLNDQSYRVEIALYFEVFQRRLICFFKKLSSISRSRDIVVRRRCLQTLFLGSHPYQICISSQLIFLKMKTETYIQNQYSIQKHISWASICHIVEGPRMPTSRDI